MATTARAIISAALKEIGVLAAGETPSSEDVGDGLTRLNRYVDYLQTQHLLVYTITRGTWTIVSGTASYTVGSGGDVNITRPVWVDGISFQDTATSPTTEYPLAKLTEAEYAGLRQKAQTANYPRSFYYNPTLATATVTFWPVPTSSTIEGVIYYGVSLSSFADLDTSYTLSPGYEEMLTGQLALLLCPSYARKPNPMLVRSASQSMGAVKKANIRPYELQNEMSLSFPTASRNWAYDIHRG